MTDLVPATLTSRQAVALPPQHAPAMTLSEVERVCNMIAAGGEMVPPAYRGKPGAVLLAKLWADAHGVDLFTAVQNISPIEGKPYVAAEMRVAMAVAKGFEFRVIESTREVCTLRVIRGDQMLGEVTCSISDSPRRMTYSNGKPTPWASHPDDMLFAEACRKADRRFVKTAAALLDRSQDYDDYGATADAAAVLAATTPAGDDVLAGDDEPTDAEIVADTVPDDHDTDEAVTVDDLLAAAQIGNVARPRSALLKHAQTALGWSGGTLDDLVADQHVASLLLDAIAAGEVQ